MENFAGTVGFFSTAHLADEATLWVVESSSGGD